METFAFRFNQIMMCVFSHTKLAKLVYNRPGETIHHM